MWFRTGIMVNVVLDNTDQYGLEQERRPADHSGLRQDYFPMWFRAGAQG